MSASGTTWQLLLLHLYWTCPSCRPSYSYAALKVWDEFRKWQWSRRLQKSWGNPAALGPLHPLKYIPDKLVERLVLIHLLPIEHGACGILTVMTNDRSWFLYLPQHTPNGYFREISFHKKEQNPQKKACCTMRIVLCFTYLKFTTTFVCIKRPCGHLSPGVRG